MLSSAEILDRVFSGKISFIGRTVKVQYDNRIDLPIDFYFEDEHFEILEIINFKKKNIFISNYLLRTNKGIFGINSYKFSIPYTKINFNLFWTLNFKVIE